jgi:exonuclease SbcD
MRLLHTADWHLGSRFHDRRRSLDEDDALEQLVALCREREVDAVLHAGDVFDNANPGAEDQERYYRALARLVKEAGVATVVVVAGNHDSALRLEGPRALLGRLGIHVVGRLGREDSGEGCLIELENRRGEAAALAVALPYLRDADLRLAAGAEQAPQADQRYRRALEGRYRDTLAAARERAAGRPVVVMGHCLALGASFGGGERPVQVGNLGAVSALELAGDAAYLALGHLHQPQEVGHPSWRYCGSLLPTGFDEAGQGKSFLLVDLPERAGGAALVEAVALRPYRRYRRLSGDLDALRAQLLSLEPPAAGEPTPFAEATLRLSGPQPGLAPELVEACRVRGWDLVSIRHERREGLGQEPAIGRTLVELSPEEVFVRCHQAEYGLPPQDDLLIEFRRLLEELPAGAGAAAGTGQRD